MSVFTHIPALVRMAFVFILVLFAIRKKMSLGNAFMLGAAALALFFAMTVPTAAKSMFFSIIYPKTLSLALVVVAWVLALAGA